MSEDNNSVPGESEPAEPVTINGEELIYESGQFPYRIPKGAGLNLEELFGCKVTSQYVPDQGFRIITSPNGVTMWGILMTEDISLNRAAIEQVAKTFDFDVEHIKGSPPAA